VDPLGLYCLTPQQINGLSGAAGGAFSGAIAMSELGPFGWAVGGLLGEGFGGLVGLNAPTSSWGATGMGAVSGLMSGINTPNASALGGLVGGAVASDLQSRGVSNPTRAWSAVRLAGSLLDLSRHYSPVPLRILCQARYRRR
jgi:hypothetical protein